MKHCLAIVLTIGVAAFFWIQWWHAMQLHIAQTRTITVMLENQGLERIRVYPLTEDCYSWNALKDSIRPVNGKVCLGDKP